MTKPLHEQLREIKEERIYGKEPSGAIKVLCKKLNISICGNCNGVELYECIQLLAARIEKEYVLLPRFEDGQPVKEGDSFIQKFSNEADVLTQLEKLRDDIRSYYGKQITSDEICEWEDRLTALIERGA